MKKWYQNSKLWTSYGLFLAGGALIAYACPRNGLMVMGIWLTITGICLGNEGSKESERNYE